MFNLRHHSQQQFPENEILPAGIGNPLESGLSDEFDFL
jgi:hypothetical protein